MEKAARARFEGGLEECQPFRPVSAVALGPRKTS